MVTPASTHRDLSGHRWGTLSKAVCVCQPAGVTPLMKVYTHLFTPVNRHMGKSLSSWTTLQYFTFFGWNFCDFCVCLTTKQQIKWTKDYKTCSDGADNRTQTRHNCPNWAILSGRFADLMVRCFLEAEMGVFIQAHPGWVKRLSVICCFGLEVREDF